MPGDRLGAEGDAGGSTGVADRALLASGCHDADPLTGCVGSREQLDRVVVRASPRVQQSRLDEGVRETAGITLVAKHAK